MKKLFTLLVFLLISVLSYSQMSITYQANALVSGDTVISYGIQYIVPGSDGAGQIWDFSQIHYTGENRICLINAINSKGDKDSTLNNFTTNENGHTYFCSLTQNAYLVTGYLTDDLSLTYDEQLLKVNYPFSYGDLYTSPISGNALYNATTALSFTGDNSVKADAYGTLVLPDCIINNALRVRAEKNSFEIRECNDMTAHAVQYCWYAPGFRYPVLTINIMEYKTSVQDSMTYTQTSFLSLQQSGTSYSHVQQNAPDNSDFTVAVYPNPYSEKLTFSYFLRKQMPVSISLYDISGKKCLEVCNSLQKSEGLHTGNIENADKLPTGVYSVKFIFDHNTIVKKVVKI